MPCKEGFDVDQVVTFFFQMYVHCSAAVCSPANIPLGGPCRAQCSSSEERKGRCSEEKQPLQRSTPDLMFLRGLGPLVLHLTRLEHGLCNMTSSSYFNTLALSVQHVCICEKLHKYIVCHSQPSQVTLQPTSRAMC